METQRYNCRWERIGLKIVQDAERFFAVVCHSLLGSDELFGNAPSTAPMFLRSGPPHASQRPLLQFKGMSDADGR